MMPVAARTDLIEPLVEIALAAGQAILEVYARVDEHTARIKGDGLPVTDADARAEDIILAGLAKVSPGIPVVAEEAVAAGNVPETRGRPFYLVDPLDGTKEFLSRNGEFTVNIGLIERGRPVLGVVYAPAIGELYVGGEGGGSRMAKVANGARGSWQDIQACAADASAIRVIASRSHLTQETRDFIEQFQCETFLSAGSSLKFCRVACGQADLYPRIARTMEWDTAAADAVLRAAGGRVTTLDGQLLEYGKRNQAEDSDFANPPFIASGAWRPITR